MWLMRRNPSPYGGINGVESYSGRLMRSYGLNAGLTLVLFGRIVGKLDGTREKIISICIINRLECN